MVEKKSALSRAMEYYTCNRDLCKFQKPMLFCTYTQPDQGLTAALTHDSRTSNSKKAKSAGSDWIVLARLILDHVLYYGTAHKSSYHVTQIIQHKWMNGSDVQKPDSWPNFYEKKHTKNEKKTRKKPLTYTIITLSIGTDRPEQSVYTLIRYHRTQHLIRVYTVCHSSGSFYTH